MVILLCIVGFLLATEVGELLIAKCADVNTKDKNGRTPLDWSINKKYTSITDLLRQHGGKTSEELKTEGNENWVRGGKINHFIPAYLILFKRNNTKTLRNMHILLGTSPAPGVRIPLQPPHFLGKRNKGKTMDNNDKTAKFAPYFSRSSTHSHTDNVQIVVDLHGKFIQNAKGENPKPMAVKGDEKEETQLPPLLVRFRVPDRTQS